MQVATCHLHLFSCSALCHRRLDNAQLSFSYFSKHYLIPVYLYSTIVMNKDFHLERDSDNGEFGMHVREIFLVFSVHTWLRIGGLHLCTSYKPLGLYSACQSLPSNRSTKICRLYRRMKKTSDQIIMDAGSTSHGIPVVMGWEWELMCWESELYFHSGIFLVLVEKTFHACNL